MLGLGRGTLVVEPPTSCDKATIRDGVGAEAGANTEAGRAGLVAPRNRVGRADEGDRRDARRDARSRSSKPTAAASGRRRCGSAWTISAIRHRDAEWAEPLLDASPGKPSPLWSPMQDHDLLAVLPPDRRDDFLLRRLRAESGPLRPSHPAFGLRRVADEPGRHARPPARSSAAFGRSSPRSVRSSPIPRGGPRCGSGRAGSTTRSITTIRSSP